jgi:multisubunit Na+/H+ antiporter MnhC subunit
MVAATGQSAFYGALWILTLIRVGAFLAGAVPLTLLGIQGIMDTEGVGETFFGQPLELALWFTALVSGFALATLVASLADLKHRHHLLSMLYKYVPLALCLLGTVVWTFTFILDGPLFGHLRTVITAIPVLGMGPVLVAPALKPELFALSIHTVLTVLLAGWALRSNARWFAAHLEEL